MNLQIEEEKQENHINKNFEDTNNFENNKKLTKKI